MEVDKDGKVDKDFKVEKDVKVDKKARVDKDDVVEDAMVEGVRELRTRSSRGMSRDHMVVFSSSLSRALFIARARCVTFDLGSVIFRVSDFGTA